MTQGSDQWRLMKEILADLLDAPRDERAELLAARCGHDPALKAEIEALLDDYGTTHLFDKPLPLLTTDDFPALSTSELEPDDYDGLIGSHIGPFRLVRRVGEGGMGRVYEALQDNGEIKRKVAIKLIKSGASSEVYVQRFHRERKVLAIQTHPNIARLFDSGTTADGLPYFVMEFVEGVPIDRYCDQHAFTVKQRLELFLKVCAAVSSAHRHLIIHRDLKPSNILVTQQGELKLLDFGIAKPLDHERTGDETLQTTPASRFLTPEFASPEQILGKPVSTAADIYSLGVLLYYLLTSRLPIQFRTGSPFEWEKAAAEGRIDKPSTVVGRDDDKTADAARHRRTSPQKLRKLLSGEIDNIVAKALNKEPERRYVTVQQFSDDINRFLAGLPVLAQADTLAYRMRKFMGRHRLAVAAAGIVGLSLVSAVIGIVYQARKAKSEAETARTVVAFMKEMVTSANPYDGDGGRNVTVAETLDRAVETIEPRFQDKPGINAEVRTAIGVTYLSLGLYDEAEKQLSQALALLETIHNPPHLELASGLKELGITYHYLGNFERADDLLSRAVAMFAALGKDHLSYANALNELAMVCQEQGKYDLAGDYFSRARYMFRRLHGPDHEDVVTLTVNLAVNAHYLGNLEMAETLYGESLELLRVIYGEKHPDIAIVLGNLAQVLVEREDYDGAEARLKQSLALKRELLGDDHHGVGLDYHNLGGVNFRKQAYEAALDYLERALAVYARAYPDDHIRVGQSLLLKGNIYNAMQRFEVAEAPLRRALVIFEKNLPPEHQLIAASQSGLGECLTNLGRYGEAETHLLASYASLKDQPSAANRLRTTVTSLVTLYKTWPRANEAAKFQKVLDSEALKPPQ